MLRRVKVIREQTEFGEEIRPDCDPPFSVIEYQGDTVIVETIHEAGEPASWSEIKNPIYFDIQIGDQLYSFRRTPSSVRVGLDAQGRVCRIEEEYWVEEDGKLLKKTRKKRKLVPGSIAVRGHKIGILNEEGEFITDPEAEFEDKVEHVTRRLKDIKLEKEGKRVLEVKS